MTEAKSFVFRFGEMEVREREFLLIKLGELSGEAIAVEPKAFRVLLFLLRNPGRLVTKDEILSAVWEDVSVSDNSLTRSVATLRRLLGDDAREPRYIATVQTIGYRFLAPVEVKEEGNGVAEETKALTPVSPSAALEVVPARSAAVGQRRRRGIFLVATAAVVVTGIGVFVVTRGHMWPRRWVPPKVVERRLTAHSQDLPVLSAAISGDGKYLAFTDRSGLYLRQVEGGETHALTLPPELASAHVESWFPDGTHLAVSSWKRSPGETEDLWKVSVLGGGALRLVGDAKEARVSPDGAQVAFLRSTKSQSEMWCMSLDGGAARRVLSSSASEEEYFGPAAWSPDSGSLAYTRQRFHRNGTWETKIEILHLASGQIDFVLANQRLGPGVAWAGSGFLIYNLWEPEPTQGDSNLWAVDLRAKGRPTWKMTTGRASITDLSASADGKSLVMRRFDPQGDTYIAELGSGPKLIGAPVRMTKESWSDGVFSWTPDSRSILIVSDRDGKQHIYRQAVSKEEGGDVERPQPELLVGGSHSYQLPKVSPAGDELLYLQLPLEAEPDKDVKIMRMPLKGGEPREVLHGPAIWNLQCGRRPAKICLYSAGGAEHMSFRSFDPLTGESSNIEGLGKRVTDWPNWSLSPDGKHVGMSVPGRRGDALVRTFTVTGELEKEIPLSGWTDVNGIDWAADGQSLWVSACIRESSPWGFPNTCSMLNVDLNGRITTLVADRELHYMAAVPAPDGKRLALAVESADNVNVWLVKEMD